MPFSEDQEQVLFRSIQTDARLLGSAREEVRGGAGRLIFSELVRIQDREKKNWRPALILDGQEARPPSP